MRYSAPLFGLLALLTLSGCAHDKYAWLNDLPVKAETSFKDARKQDIRLLEVYETRDVSGQVWLRGKGYASVNDDSTRYFWDSKTPPLLEVSVARPDNDEYKQCRILLDQMKSTRRAVQLVGDGFFAAKGNETDGMVGVFKIDRVKQCIIFTPTSR